MEKNESYYKYWGKASKNIDYHLLPYHSLDVASVGYVILEENSKLLHRFSELTHLPENLFKQLFLFFLSLHDLGKFSDSFQGQVKEIYSKLNPDSTPKVYNIRHDSLGFMLWNKIFLINNKGNLSGPLVDGKFFHLESANNKIIKNLLNIFISVTTGHHGTPPSNTGYTGNSVSIEFHFTKENVSNAFQFLKQMYEFYFQDEILKELVNLDIKNVVECLNHSSFWLAGLSVLCDWIGSNRDVFKYKTEAIPIADYWNQFAIPSAREAVQSAGILPCSISKYSTPTELFSNPRDNISFVPTPLQAACNSLDLKNKPQLIILEDVTGAGKTEAALILAKRLMENTASDGLFVGLPTMATSNGMYTRVAKFYKKLYEANSNPSLVLAHGARGLSESFRETIIAERIPEDVTYADDEGSASANCLAWLADSNKKATLADVAVGTIDQVLISILLSKFQSLRLFGLMNKVLILDEVHAYDSYMNELIETLLKAQAKIGGSVILLTATMPHKLKKKFISAYQSILKESEIKEQLNDSYPLITQVSLDCNPIFIPVETREEVKRTVELQFIHDINEIYSLIEESVEEDKCVCWICNTVTDAMNSYETLISNSKFSKENIILFHARFAMGDRLDKEQKVLQLFGKESNSKDRSGKIVIATQVVEQSLDLDFDLMITDLAPIDLVIQRAGRLHRHTRDRYGNRIFSKDEREKPKLYVFSPEVTDNPERNWYSGFFRGGAKVYPDHGKLYLSAKVLNEKGELKMPEEARSLIEYVYGDKELIPKNLLEITKENENSNQQKVSQAQNNTINIESGYTALDNGTIWNDITAPTRLGEETIRVILAKWEDKKLLPWYNEGKFQWANSEVKVMSYILKSEKEIVDSELQNAIKQCKENLPDKGKYSVLLPLKNENGDWIGTAMDREGKEGNYKYDTNIGFRKIKEGEGI